MFHPVRVQERSTKYERCSLLAASTSQQSHSINMIEHYGSKAVKFLGEDQEILMAAISAFDIDKAVEKFLLII
jgi:hypothetical protein